MAVSQEGTGLEQTIGNYTILRLLGKGGMGSVYEARHNMIERRAAIKVLHPEFCEDPDVLKRFVNEARAVNIIGHPGLIGVSEFGQTPEGARYIVMEYVDGITLREKIHRAGGRLPLDQVIKLSRQIASILAAAHAKQIVHRDLKPVNIMLVTEEDGEQSERVKVLDFGIAKLNTEGMSQTKSGVMMGTPAYMSPEQCRSGRNAVDRSDVYALGIIMYEMLAGQTPFVGGPAALLAGHLAMDPPVLTSLAPNVTPEIAALIHRMIAKNPSDRPTASEVARNLSSGRGSTASLSQLPVVLASSAAPADARTLYAAAAASTSVALKRLRDKLRENIVAVVAGLILLLALGSLWALLMLTGRSTGAAVADLGKPDARAPVIEIAQDASAEVGTKAPIEAAAPAPPHKIATAVSSTKMSTGKLVRPAHKRKRKRGKASR